MPAEFPPKIIAEASGEVKSIFFLGAKQGVSLLASRAFKDPWAIERARKGEEAGFKASGLIKTNKVGDADIVYVRVNPERISKRKLKSIARIEKNAPSNAIVVNSTSLFPNYSDKSQCFDLWTNAELSCPAFESWNPWSNLDQQCLRTLASIKQFDGVYLRTSNEDSGKGMAYLGPSTGASEVRKTLKSLRFRTIHSKVSNSKILAVQPIKNMNKNGFGHVFRVHYVAGKIHCGYAICGPKAIIHSGDMRISSWDEYLKANAKLLELLSDESIRNKILSACSTLGAQVGAVEFFMIQDKPVFLEFNPQWGGKHRFGDASFNQKLEQNLELPELKLVKKWMNAESFYEGLYQSLSKLHEGVSSK